MKTKWMSIPLMVLALGCVREVEKNDAFYVEGEFTLYASSGEPETRTVIQEDGRVFWSLEDCINVYYGDKSGMFTSTNTEPAASAEFTGTLGSFTLDGETEFVAAYPYSDANAISGTTLTMTLPAEQTAVEGTFADDLFISVAKSKDYKLHFYNVCGGVQFSLARGDIKKVVFRGNNGESLAGRLTVEFGSDGKPQVSGIEDGSTSVTLVAPGDGTFKEGSFYYIVLVPQVLREGYTMELYSDVLVGTIRFDSSVTVRRSAWGVLKNLGPEAPGASDGAIVLERKYMVYSKDNPVYCYPGISLILDNEQHLRIGYYDTKYWSSNSTERHGIIVTCGIYEDITLNEEWYVQPRVSGEWVQEKVIVNPGGKVQYYSNGDFIGEHEFSAPILEGASSLYVEVNPWGWWYTHYHFMDDFKLTTPYQTITDDFNNGVLDLTIWEEPVNPDGVFVEDGVVKTIQKRTDQDFCLRSKPIFLGPIVPVESVSLDKTSLVISVGSEATLNATVLPENATNKTVFWSSSNESIATVSSSGFVLGMAPGSAIITVTTADGGKTATCTVTVTTPYTVATPVAIDLGLPSGLKWASFNLGATSPEEYGDYFAWGETEPKSNYSWSTYKWCMGSENTLTKYCSNADYGYNEFTDDKTVLNPEDDAAHVNLGDKWRIPTIDDLEELRGNCVWEWTSMNGIYGRKVTGPNGNSIFLPAAGMRALWSIVDDGNSGSLLSSSVSEFYSYSLRGIKFISDEMFWSTDQRCLGESVRPVYDDSWSYSEENLVAYYPFNGSADDASGHGNHGVLSGPNVPVLTTDRFGIANSAYEFGGYNNYNWIRVPNSESLVFDKEFTVSYWIQLAEFVGMDGWGKYSTDPGFTPLSKAGDGNATYPGLYFYLCKGEDGQGMRIESINTNGNVRYDRNVNHRLAYTKSDYQPGDWLHIVLVVRDTEKTLYVNGAEAIRDELNRPADFSSMNSHDLYIGIMGGTTMELAGWGSLEGGWYPFYGKIDDIKIYNCALDAQRVAQL